jgi:hypothetical protein
LFSLKNGYICTGIGYETMRKELGKWLLDVAKYVATAVLISSFLGGLNPKWMMYVCGSAVVISLLVVGFWLLNKNDK